MNPPEGPALAATLTDPLARARQQLHGLSALHRQLQDAPDVLVLTQDRRGRILSANHYAARLAGEPPERLRRRPFRSLLQDPCPQLDPGLSALLQGRRQDLRHEAAVRQADGSRRPVSWWHLPWPGHPGRARILSIGLDRDSQQRAERQATWLARHDPLTGLLHRRAFMEGGRDRIAAVRGGRLAGFALLRLDLDQFRHVNDLSSHQIGDRLLCDVAALLRQSFPADTLLARLDGDEFGLLVNDTDRSRLARLAQGCLTRLDHLGTLPGQAPVPISASLGMVCCPDDGDRIETLMSHADLALGQSKALGRGRWHHFDARQDPRQHIHQRLHWEQQLRRALQQQRVDVHFQPILNLHTGRISHHEALLRVGNGRGGHHPAPRLIQAAECSGMIHALDQQVLDVVCRRLSQLRRRGQQAAVAVNLSGLSFRDAGLVEQVQDCLTRHRVPARSLIFEITETAALSDLNASVAMMQTLRRLGCRFALDDFGAGFSSLAYLKKLPLDFVKIDGDFIRSLDQQPEHRVLIRALVDVAAAFQLQTVAEFVENDQILQTLRELGVDFAQGYHIDLPRPFEQCWPRVPA